MIKVQLAAVEDELLYDVFARYGEPPLSLEEKLRMPRADRWAAESTGVSAILTIGPNRWAGRFLVRHILISGQDVTGVLLRTLPVQALVEEALGHLERNQWPGLRPIPDVTKDDAALWPKQKERIAGLIGEIYVQSSLRGLAPVDEIERRFDVSRRTATRMVAFAREYGSLSVEPVHSKKRKAHDDGESKTRSRTARENNDDAGR